MAGLQRSEVSFRRQGSSGLVWDDRFLSGELNKLNQKDEQASEPQLQGSGGGVGGHQEGEAQGQERVRDHNNNINMKDVKPARSVNTMERSRSNGGGRGYRTGRVSPAIEPPSPRVSACGFCSAFSKTSKKNQLKKSGKRRSR
ncbi:MAPK kinase substrate protein At1g80180-like [Mangifera indica]|uniref:MAPK kinase substrate protein At1g80180-like n=1 Tax=Mangifera indica TaxID=29780 RepID=UPI001CF95199|nr:MAPK kinase substrate protein At1g80180-like [Mangifera indica]